jgi:hypothetical protein
LLFFIIQLKSPEKTFLNCLINEALTPMRYFRIGEFKRGERQLRDINAILDYAKRKGKLTDLGDLDFIDQYNILMHSEVQEQQRYTNLGYLSATIELNMNFVRRLKLIQYYKDVPKVLSVPVRAPVFVMGLPRTGTTFLHRLLSLDPAVRAPLLWELLNPVPKPLEYDANPAAFEEDRKKRAKFVKNIIATRKSLGDHALDHIHEIEYDLPEECIMGLTDTLPVMMQYLYANYMTFAETIKMDPTKAYEGYRHMLQLLSYQVGEAGAPRKWMLKCPIHLFFIKQIAKVFPDAQLIWTHRHPVSAVPSLCSLIKAFHSVYYEPECCDKNNLGKIIAEGTGSALKSASRDIAESKLQCGHVVYNDLVSDPIATVKRIYAQMNWPFTDEYQNRLESYLEENRKKRESLAKKQGSDKGSLHHYSPSTYGLTETELCSGLYEEYVNKYNVPMSKN